MTKWLQKFSQASMQKIRSTNLPVVRQEKNLNISRPLAAASGIPAASLIYGVAASVLFIMGLYFLFTGRWFTGFLVFLPAIALFGFAMHFLRR